MKFDQFEAYKSLKESAKQQKSLTTLFEDKRRTESFSVKSEHLYFDFSRQLADNQVMNSLFKLAEETDLKAKVAAMFEGKKINVTEDRSVRHVALRDFKNMLPEVSAVLNKIEAFSKSVSDKFKNILSIGIGGSYLGPEYLAEACAPFAQKGMRLIFVANVDGTDFVKKTAELDPAETLVIIVSKTFTTAETMKNAASAKKWITDALGDTPEVIKKHFAAVSTAKDKVEAFGIDAENMFGFWDWVGGRYSATSAVGAVPLSLYLGFDNFKKILAGAHWMDQHFLNEPTERNIPVLSALLDVWNINFLGYKTRALLPYSQGLAKLPAHTQQVEMESNGKLVDINGEPVGFDTGEIVFGEPGTNGQHSFYQLIHQGTQIVPCDFIGFVNPQYQLGESSPSEVDHHKELMTNFFAQPDALAFGKKDPYGPKNFPGNRPSSSFMLKALTPFTAGLLLAWTEHRAAAKGFIWGINSFDQFGVELGKVLGVDLRKRMLKYHSSKELDKAGLNRSTAFLLDNFLKGDLPS